MIYFTSDTHFGHNKLIEQDFRNFKNVEEMDRILISNWNKTVNKNDEIYILGDFTLKKDEDYISNILDKLNGKKYLIKGNHDYFIKNKDLANKFIWVKDYYELKHNKKKFILSHYPFEEWNGSRTNSSYHLHGHTHSLININNSIKKYDVGVDCNNYTPISIEEIINLKK